MSSQTRRTVMLGLSAAPLVTALPAFAAEEPAAAATAVPFDGDVIIGDKDAPVTVYEYVSYTCGYCGRVHQTVWPEIKATYVDTGKVKFVLRPFYRNTVDLDVDILSRCGGEEAFYPLADVYLNTQSVWTRHEDIPGAVRQIARRAGMPEARIDACLDDYDFKKTLVESFRENAAAHDVQSTPTFVIGNTVHRGLISVEGLAEIIDSELGA
ncbi:MAG: thioredoxin domain-containing protein [Pseudomonadota bacterium]